MTKQFDKSVARLFLIAASIIILIVASCLTALFLSSQYSSSSFYHDNLYKGILESKKEFLRNAVDRTINDIENHRAHCTELSNHAQEAGEPDLLLHCSEAALQERLKNNIRNTILINNGYLWVNKVLNYQGGEDYAIRLVHPNLVETEGSLLSTETKDIMGNSPYLTELEGVREHGEIFFRYWFKKMGSADIAEKLTYAKLYPDYDWIIASGVYMDDLDAMLAVQKEQGEKTFRHQIFIATVFILFSVVVAFLVSLFFLRRIRSTIDSYDREIREKESSLERQNVELERRVAERTHAIEESKAKFKESKEKWRSILVNVAQIGISIDSSGYITFANDFFLTLTGWAREEVLGQDWFELFIPETTREEVRRNFDRTIERKGSDEFTAYEIDILTRWGEIRTIAWSNALTLGPDGEVTNITSLGIDLTERIQASKKIQQSEIQIRSLIEQFPEGIAIFSLEGSLQLYNSALFQLSNLGRNNDEETIAFNIRESQLAEGYDIRTLFEKAAGGTPCESPVFENWTGVASEEKVPDTDVTDNKYLRARCIPISDSGGKYHQVALTLIDHTDLIMAQQSLLRSNQRYQNLFQNSPIPLWEEDFTKLFEYLEGLREQGISDLEQYFEHNPDQVLICAGLVEVRSVNRACLHLHGAESTEELLAGLGNIFNEKSLTAFKDELIALAAGEKNISLEGEVQRLDGTPVQVQIELNIDPLPDQSNRAILATIDITSRKEAEIALRESEKEYRELVELAQEGIWVLDRNFETVFVNPAMAGMLGASVDEMAGVHINSFTDDKKFSVEELKEHITGTGEQFEIDLLRKDGSPMHAVVAMARLNDRQGQFDGVIGGFLDMTDRRRNEDERHQLQRQLAQAQKMQSIGNLAGGIAHDFNNLLSSIIGFTELALDEAEPGGELEDSLREIHAAGARARDLVKQILAFARQSDEERKPIQLSGLVKEVTRFIRSTIPSSIEISQEINSSALTIGNPTQFHQMLMNLYTNAAHAMAESGGLLEVQLDEIDVDTSPEWKELNLKAGRYLHLVVTDTGIGIDEDIIDYIFEPYFTTKETGEGTGMGLAMVKGIIESCDGAITVESSEGEGSVFKIYLPVTSRIEKTAPYQKQQLPGGNERILFVDDEPPIIKMSKLLLTSMGYELTTYTSSREALECFRGSPEAFDLVITDMTMPEITGDKLATEMLAVRPNLPIIMCTGYNSRISPEKAKEIGIRAFIYKPVDKVDMAKTIREVLDK